jgi:hypothetical protein
MKKTFVIAWRSATSERSGRGKKLMTIGEAEALATELNQEYPAFIHEAVDAEAVPMLVETAQAA